MGTMTASGRPGAGDDRPDGTEGDWKKLAVESIVSDLDSAHEELRVTEEELKAQQEEIDRLLRLNQTEELWQERLIANLPVGVVVTDRDGKVKSANSAACAVLGLTQMNLLRKPLQTFVGAEDRQEFRQVLSLAYREGRGRSLVCAMQPRGAPDAAGRAGGGPRPRRGLAGSTDHLDHAERSGCRESHSSRQQHRRGVQPAGDALGTQRP